MASLGSACLLHCVDTSRTRSKDALPSVADLSCSMRDRLRMDTVGLYGPILVPC